jgi:hypothetical protein
MNIKSEFPATGIMKTFDNEDSAAYRIACDCHTSDHDINMWVELDRDEYNINVSFYVESYTPWWNQYFNRFKVIWKLLTTGYFQREHHTILNSQTALNFANTIISEVERLENVKKSKNNE